jgi:uncharacterized protein (DUF427 family)
MSTTTTASLPCSRGFHVETQSKPVIIRRHDAVVAATTEAVLVYEDGLVPVYYIPRKDVYVEHLVEVPAGPEGSGDHDLRYFSITASGGGVERGAWMFMKPTGPLESLTGRIGFDPDSFNITVG